MMKLKQLFGIRREERWYAVVMALVAVALNVVFSDRLYPFLTTTMNPDEQGEALLKLFHISGYDPYLYSMLSHFDVLYNPFRHPLYTLFFYPFTLFNQGLMLLTGTNCALYVVAVLMVVNAVYSLLFFRRILVDVLSLGRMDADICCLLLYSMAYLLLTLFVPDHFSFSFTLLLFTAWVAGTYLKKGIAMSGRCTLVLFLLTAGVTLSNGIKIWLASLFTRGRRFFSLRHLLCVVAVPAAFLWGMALMQQHVFFLPHQQVAKERQDKRKQAIREKRQRLLQQAIATGDSARIARLTRRPARRQQPVVTPISESGFLKWTDTSTPRWESWVENVWGETVLLHTDKVLEDTLISRPAVVYYKYWWQYVPQVLLLLLFAGGIVVGRRLPFMWMLLSWWTFDMLLHLGIGFGLNEVFIMAPHWLFVVPLVIGLLFASDSIRNCKPLLWTLRSVVMLLALFLLVYNAVVTLQFLLGVQA
ncbi:MAG: DUF6080 domain-containing protein [Prevotella sp.]